VLIIRKFEPIDMFSVIKLASETLPERYSPSLFNFFYETYPKGFIVAEKDHKIIGFIIGVQMKPEKGKILMLSVLEKYRRQGIGSKLLAEYLKGISNKKIKKVALEVRTDNKKAIKFYQRYGFKIKKKISEFYQNGEDAYTMAKEL
jgi:ribosomal-protein-alanine N-acetyltransferase